MRGRIRVRLKDAEGKFTHAEIHTRRDLFVKVAELIPKLKSRQPGYHEVRIWALHSPHYHESRLLSNSVAFTELANVVISSLTTSVGFWQQMHGQEERVKGNNKKKKNRK